MIIVYFILIFVMPQASTDEVDFFFRKGNELYESGKYAEAMEHYEKALASGYKSGALYYNIGNVYFKMGQTGKSILFYERAKQLLPRDEDVTFNLQIANLFVVDKVVVPQQFYIFKIVSEIKHFYSINTLSWIALAFYILTMTFIIIRILFRHRVVKQTTKLFLVPTVFILCVFVLILSIRFYDQATTSNGIIMTEKVEVLSSPADDGTELFSLHEGVKVRIEDSSGNWLKILLADGKVGWIDKSVVERI